MLSRFFLILSGLLILISGIGWSLGYSEGLGIWVVLLLFSLAMYIQFNPSLRTYAYTVWIFVFVAAAMFFPSFFIQWGNFELKSLMIPLIQIVLFGMGTTLSLKDFSRILSEPKAVIIGIFLQYAIMPLLGVTLAYVFGFEPLVAAGVVLVGSCPSGLSSNVITYLAKGNVALSVTVTGCTTLISPLMTPLMMKLLAGQYIQIDFFQLMWTIIQIIVVPIIAGLIVNKILRTCGLQGPWMDKILSFSAMSAICIIVAIIAALSRDKLLTVGFLLFLAVMLHNGMGYLLGYWGSRLFGLDESACRAISVEVGLQNGGMASGLALNVLKSSDAALAAAIFASWMNISGSILASWWRRRPVSIKTK